MARRKTGTKRGNGEGTVLRRSDGRWVAKLSLPNGRRKDFYGRTREIAVGKMEEGRSFLRTGQPLASDRVLVGGYVKIWLGSKRVSVRFKTYENWESLFRLHVVPRVGSISLAKLSPLHLQQLYADLLAHGLSPSTVATVHRALKNMLRTAQRMDIIPRCVADNVQPPRIVAKELLILSEQQAKSLLIACQNPRLGPLFELALMTGARRGEMLALRWRDVSFENEEIRIQRSLQRSPGGFELGETKTRAGIRTVPLDPRTIETLRRHRSRMVEEALKIGPAWNNQHDLVFVSKVGTALNPTNVIKRHFRPLVVETGLPKDLRLHDLRHFFASYNLSRGMPVPVVSKVMGHSSPAVTYALYAHCIPGHERGIAATMNGLRAS